MPRRMLKPVVVRTRRFGSLELNSGMTIGDVRFLQELERDRADVDDRSYTVSTLHRLLITPELREEDLSGLTDWVLRRVARIYMFAVYPEHARVNPSRIYQSFRSAVTSSIAKQTRAISDALKPITERFQQMGRVLSESLLTQPSVASSKSLTGVLGPPVWPLLSDDPYPPRHGSPAGGEAASVREDRLDEVDGIWSKVSRQLERTRERLANASAEEDFQSVGHLCREVLISLAEAVYVRKRHPPLDGKEPSATDAKRRLQAYVAVELRGSSKTEVRKSVRANVDLAVSLQHDRNATETEAAICLVTTDAVVKAFRLIAQSA